MYNKLYLSELIIIIGTQIQYAGTMTAWKTLLKILCNYTLIVHCTATAYFDQLAQDCDKVDSEKNFKISVMQHLKHLLLSLQLGLKLQQNIRRP